MILLAIVEFISRQSVPTLKLVWILRVYARGASISEESNEVKKYMSKSARHRIGIDSVPGTFL